MELAGTLPYFLIVLAALGGFSIALYIWSHKRIGTTLVCPVGTSCDSVIHSDYSKFFGIPVELLGIAYYGIIALAYALAIVWPVLSSIVFVLLGLSLVAFLFSAYLTFIQAFTLRQWCTWCLISAGLCTLIFALAIVGSEYTFFELLETHHGLIVGFHLLGVVLGLGGATISDVLFFRFLKDLRISQFEANTLRSVSQVIWFGLAILIVSGLGLYLPHAAELGESPKLLVKMIVVAVIIVNGAFLNLFIAPRLVRISFWDGDPRPPSEPKKIRRLAYALGAVSIVSWYSAFILGLMRSSPADFETILYFYLFALAISVIGSQIIERLISRRALNPIP